MATAIKTAVIPAYTLHGGPPLQKTYPEAASQTFKRGEAVYLDGNGRVAEYTAAIDDGTQRFLGFAAEDGHNGTAGANNCSVYLGWGTVFEINVTNAGADQTTAITQVGSGPLPLYQDTTNSIAMLDIGDTAAQGDWCRIVAISTKGLVGDTNGRVEFTLVPAALQVTGT